MEQGISRTSITLSGPIRVSMCVAGVFMFLMFVERWSFAEAIEPMPQAHDGMPPDHARPGVTHHHLDLFLPMPLIAMHGTIRAGWFFRSEPAAIQPRHRVVRQRPALATQISITRVLAGAITMYHGRHCPPFTRQPTVFENVNGNKVLHDRCSKSPISL